MKPVSTLKFVVWGVFALLALLWTAGSYIAVALARWGSQLLASGGFDTPGRTAAQWPLPEGLPLWFDPALLQFMQQMALVSLEALRDALPMLGAAMGWLVPLLWALWAFGLLVLLVIAGGAHWLVARQAPAAS